MNILKDNWARICAETIRQDRYRYLTVTNRSMFRILSRLLALRHEGLVIDIGAGGLAFKNFLVTRFDRYVSCDLLVHRESPVDIVADATRLPLQAETAEWAFLSAVMEHCPRPEALLPEVYRVLKPGGRLLITAPHIHPIHGEPHDYFRFTRFGLHHLLESNHFHVLAMVPVAGLIGFLSTLISTGFLALASACGRLWLCAYLLNRLWVALTGWADRRIDTCDKFAIGYIAVGLKKNLPGR